MLGEYVVGIPRCDKERRFLVLAAMNSRYVGMFVRDAYNEAYKKAGLREEAVLLEKGEVPKNYEFRHD